MIFEDEVTRSITIGWPTPPPLPPPSPPHLPALRPSFAAAPIVGAHVGVGGFAGAG
jgi:hypothetical protein